MTDFEIQFWANIVSGVAVAVLFFIFSDFIFKLPNLQGHWNFKITVKDSAYNPYKELVVDYTALLWQQGNNIYGSGEKIKDKTKDGEERQYIGKNRARIKITGYVTKKYFSRSEILIHIEEINEQRTSSTVHLLKKTKKQLNGSYISTIADSSGVVVWNQIV